MPTKDLTGKRIDRLVVLCCVDQVDLEWSCRCDCGSIVVRVYKTLISKRKNKSCGCRKKELCQISSTKHHMASSSMYPVWNMMKQRCSNPNNPDFHNYGGRGIAVCERWQSFENFYADMGPCPGPGFSLDRFPDQNGNYEPGNCRWADTRQQQQNKRSNRNIEHNGQTRCLTEWARIFRLDVKLIHSRLTAGYSFQQAISKQRVRR